MRAGSGGEMSNLFIEDLERVFSFIKKYKVL